MGFLGGGGGGGSKTTNKPWKEQAPYLKDAFGAAQGIYNSQAGTPYYTGELHAGLDPTTQLGISGIKDYSTGAGAAAANQVAGTGSNLLNTQGDLISSIGDVRKAASTDPTAGNITSAGKYADNPYLSGAIDAASRDVTRNLYENDLPGINRDATATGNINSSRAGVASGIATRGAQDQIGDIASTMRSAAYNSGLGLAEQGREANMTGLANASNLYGQAVNTGLTAAGQGRDMNVGNLNNLVTSGQISQADAQAALDADFQKWQGNDTRASDLLNRYYSIVGDKSWGGTQTTKPSSSGTAGQILGTAASIGSLFI